MSTTPPPSYYQRHIFFCLNKRDNGEPCCADHDAQAAFDHITQNAGDFKSYVKALATSAEQGHVMVWSAHEDEQNLIADSAISGKLITEGAKPQVGVYISDETESKMDWYLHREVTTEFQKVARNGANQYTVHIKLQNTMTAEEAANM